MLRALCSLSLTIILVLSATAQTTPASPQAGAGPSTMVGCIQKNGDLYTLTDESSKATVQLRGGNLKPGRRMEVTGIPAANANPAPGAIQLMDVTRGRRMAGGCPNASARRGMRLSGTTVASIAVIGGVAAFAIIKTASRLGEASGGK
jgi:hypothetical protein